MNAAATTFEYKGNQIAFLPDDENTMINATQMAKTFGKRTTDFLKNQQTNDLMQEMTKVRNLALADLVKVKKGGVNSGTWMHEDLALVFAQWLSPQFYLWCNDRIKELMKHGVAVSHEEMLEDPDLLINALQRLKEERAEKARLAHKQKLLEGTIARQAPKVKYVDEVLQSESTYNTNQIAKELGTSAVTLNKWLREHQVQYLQNGTWLLYAKFQGKGYTKTKTHHFTRSDGTTGTQMQTVWTEKGRAFIHSLWRANK